MKQILHGTTQFSDANDPYYLEGVCTVCGDPCGADYEVCHTCAVRRRELRKKFRAIIAARRKRYCGYLSARELLRGWWRNSDHR